MNYPPMSPGPQRPIIYQPREPKRRRRFRWWVVYIPAVIVALAWIIRHVNPFVNWDELTRPFDLNCPERFRMLVILGVVAVAVCLTARVLRQPKKEENEK